MSDDKKVPEESLGKEVKEAQKVADEKSPFGAHVKPAMYILFDEAKGQFFVLGAPGFLDDSVRAYGALKIAEKNLDEFYSKKRDYRSRITEGVKNFQARMDFRRFLKFGK